MKDKFTMLIMTFIVIAIFGVIGMFGVIIYNEINETDKSNALSEVAEFKTSSINTNDTVEKNIETPKIIEKNPLDELSKNNIENSENDVNYDNIVVNKYFYNQLESYSKTIYKAFESNKENMKEGTYKINLGTSFSNILSKQNGQEELGKYYQSAIEAYTYDNPDVFYLSPNKMYLNIETTTKGQNKTYNVYINNGEEANYLNEEFSNKQDINLALEKIEAIRKQIIHNKTGNDYEDIKMVHDYLVENIEYDTSLQEKNIYNIYGALINGKCVCEGYARAFKYLLDGLGIESTMVIGKGINSSGQSENHAWNYVKLENNWYAVDCTWDDPVIIGGGYIGNSSKYRYFLKGKEDMEKDHTTLGNFTQGGKEFEYPTLNNKSYKK
ncbi:putative uncharacterized protein [Clostridium sp. CAG:440]|jgi:hypothetical protein|nr:putative uncharacterized protein [Clostridium sp. CAG:440]